MVELYLYNTLSGKKELFEPAKAPNAGMYVCGPTVYGEPHLGHARSAITFDLLFRYLRFSGYKVRYVRNITDVGHLENDADDGRDKIAEKARLEQLEPMEIALLYADKYRYATDRLNVLRPSIEPLASGHILEQIELTEKILDSGYAYVSDGSVYFDVVKYAETHDYGKLSGRILDDLRCNSRELEGGADKRSPFDFALWKKAAPEHIMRWNSPWSDGFPGWHLECSAMSKKYLGDGFDIHGGGMDLLFPHHECEMAQNAAAGAPSARYWVHNNMITVDGRKMGKSLGNFITLDQLFEGSHPSVAQAYSPMTLRFFILQAHYRSTLDFSNDALKAAEKGLNRLLRAYDALNSLKPSRSSSFDVAELERKCFEAMNDDLNSPVAISVLFDGARAVNSACEGRESLSAKDIEGLKKLYSSLLFDILGLKAGLKTEEQGSSSELTEGLVNLILTLRRNAKAGGDFAASDRIREELKQLGIVVKDTKDGASWEYGLKTDSAD
jgi:cysteinyl-tRNA synthetase